MIDFTPIARRLMIHRISKAQSWIKDIQKVQMEQLQYILSKSVNTKWGSEYGLNRVMNYNDFRTLIPICDYESYRPYVMRMIAGESDVLWPGITTRFAQSSGTSGGKSKYIPLTQDSLKLNHYAGSRDVMAHYLHLYPKSHVFSGKGFILGGSYANELNLPHNVRVGDLSANLIDNINPIVNHFRVPSKQIALMEDWKEKLPQLVAASIPENITNISGVPSWFLTVLKEVIASTGATTIHDVWPNLEVFFHGGISFQPYKDEYSSITDVSKMHYIETYNASEGFFATQSEIDDTSMLLLLDIGLFYEFIPLRLINESHPKALASWEVEPGEIYALVITGCNGLYRYLIGDTVKIESINPLKISIAGRTKTFINVFGEEVMEFNTNAALAKACEIHDCHAKDYTAGPVYPTPTTKGRHHWLIEWIVPPHDIRAFEKTLDECLQNENSDYQAKRTGSIFLDPLTIESVDSGVFDLWLSKTGKLGGQRKVSRLSNNNNIINEIHTLNLSKNCNKIQKS